MDAQTEACLEQFRRELTRRRARVRKAGSSVEQMMERARWAMTRLLGAGFTTSWPGQSARGEFQLMFLIGFRAGYTVWPFPLEGRLVALSSGAVKALVQMPGTLQAVFVARCNPDGTTECAMHAEHLIFYKEGL